MLRTALGAATQVVFSAGAGKETRVVTLQYNVLVVLHSTSRTNTICTGR